MKFRTCIVILLSVVLSACSSNQTGRVVLSTPNGNGEFNSVLLSEYFESTALISNGELLAHLIVTLGKERVPKGQEVKISWKDRKFNDQIEEVEEIYFTNNSSEVITIENVNLTYYGASRDFLDQPASIPPKSFYKTQAFISSTSLYRGEKVRLLKLKVNGVQQEVVLREKRTPVSALGHSSLQ